MAKLNALQLHKLQEYLEQDIGLDTSNVNLQKIIDTLIARELQLDDFEEIAAATAAMIAVHETHFLRHTDHFTWLKNYWLPQQVANGAIHLSILSAGCSTGEEPYSLAAQLINAAKPYMLSISIDACDINKQSLQIAKQGKYGLWSLRGVDVAHEQEWLDLHSRAVYVKEPYKSQVNFFQHNLNKPLPLENHYDLILCRNVLIYMHPKAIATIYNNLRSALKQNGVLIPGPSDPNPHPENDLHLSWQHDVRTYRIQVQKNNKAVAAPTPEETTTQARAAIPDQSDKKNTNTCNEIFCDHQLIGNMIKNGYYDAARNALKTNIKIDNFDVRSYTMLAMLSLDMDDIHCATEASRKASFLDSESCYTIYLNAEIKARKGDDTGSRRELLWAKKLLQDLPAEQEIKYCEEIRASQLLDVINSRLDCSETL